MKRFAKVLLVYANSPLDNLIPIGVSVLSACLKKGGHRVELFDTTFYKTCMETGDDVRTNTLQVKRTDLAEFGITFHANDVRDDFRKTVKDFQPDLIAISCVETTLSVAFELIEGIKDRQIPTILGGMGVFFLKEKLISRDDIDMLCIGEGEGALVDLADAIRDKKDYSHIPNLWVKKDGKVIKNEQRPLVDVNTVPFQDWSMFEKKRFLKPMGGRVRITGAIEFARGCPRMCAYCCNWGINKYYGGKYVRPKNIDRILGEIRYAREQYKLEYIYFYAENFLSTLSESDFSKFALEYKRICLPFWIETDPVSITDARIRALKEIGCEGISVGVENGNEQFRRTVLNRTFTNDQIRSGFRIAKKYGIRISANNIIGFPTETRELIFDTIRLNRELQADNVIVNLFNPYWGMKLRDIAIKNQYIHPDSVCSDYRISTIMEQPQLPKSELLGLHRTFVPYVRLPESDWGLIRRAEQLDEEGNRAFQEVARKIS